MIFLFDSRCSSRFLHFEMHQSISSEPCHPFPLVLPCTFHQKVPWDPFYPPICGQWTLGSSNPAVAKRVGWRLGSLKMFVTSQHPRVDPTYIHCRGEVLGLYFQVNFCSPTWKKKSTVNLQDFPFCLQRCQFSSVFPLNHAYLVQKSHHRLNFLRASKNEIFETCWGITKWCPFLGNFAPRLMHIPENAVLGRGSFGTVWRARDAHTGRCYAATWHRKWRFFFRWFSMFFF